MTVKSTPKPLRRCAWCGRFSSLPELVYQAIDGTRVQQIHCHDCRPAALIVARRNLERSFETK